MRPTITPLRPLAALGFLCALAGCDDTSAAHVSAQPATVEKSVRLEPKVSDEPAVREERQVEAPRPVRELESDDPCLRMCEKTEELDCREQETCPQQCAQMRGTMTACSTPVDAFFACLDAQPISNFACVDGVASLKQGLCSDEQTAVVKCASSARGG
jgi:hypothetical protein